MTSTLATAADTAQGGAPLFDAAQALRHCQLLGIDPAQAHLRAIHWKKGAKNLPPTGGSRLAQLELLQGQGFRLYLIAGGAQTDADVQSIGVLFIEWDGLTLSEQLQRLQDLQDLGLPFPTLVLSTWDEGSLHVWWRLAEPLTGEDGKARWRDVIARLITVCGSDPTCKNPSRLMRLAGSAYIQKAGKPGEGEVLGQALIHRADPYAIHPIEAFEQWLDERFAADPQLAIDITAVAPKAGDADGDQDEDDGDHAPSRRPAGSPSPSSGTSGHGGRRGDLPPRSMEEIETALAVIPQRVSKSQGAYAYPYHRLVLCGLRDACERLHPGQGERMAIDLMERHSPSGACSWDIEQVLTTSHWLGERCFWGRAMSRGWDARLEGTKKKEARAATGNGTNIPLPAPSATVSPSGDTHDGGTVPSGGDTVEALEAEVQNLALLFKDRPDQFHAAADVLLARAAALIHASDTPDTLAERFKLAFEKGKLGRATFKNAIKALLKTLKAADRAAAAQQAQLHAQDARNGAPFAILGWDQARKGIHYQVAATGQLGHISSPSGSGSSGLLSIAPLDFWEAGFPHERGGVDWIAAASWFIEQSNTRNVFRLENIRGRGAWIDDGRTVWHNGDHLLVDGAHVPLADMTSTATYILKQPLPFDPTGPQLTDEQGAAIIKAVASMGWQEPCAAHLLVGWSVLAPVGGALQHRPGLAVTAQWGKGKTTAIKRGVLPLLGGLTPLLSHITEAAIRQRAKGDALPVVIDESEQGDANGRMREGHLKLLRASYDGHEGGRGTTHGDNLEQLIRYSVALVGINATIPEGADRSRTALLTRRHLPREEWQAAEVKLDAAVTPAIGQALIRRTVQNLRTLQANIRTFARLIEAMGDTARSGDAFGALLAGCYSLTSTAEVSPEDAITWLNSIGWAGVEVQNDQTPDEIDEGRQCLDMLLSHSVRWSSTSHPSGEITLRELITAVRFSDGLINSAEAIKVLGRFGLKVEVGCERWDGLIVSNTAPSLQKIYGGTRWAKGGHVLHFRQLPGADGTKQPARFAGGGVSRGVEIPWDVVFPA